MNCYTGPLNSVLLVFQTFYVESIRTAYSTLQHQIDGRFDLLSHALEKP